jgi:HK97 family phage prohead protease
MGFRLGRAKAPAPNQPVRMAESDSAFQFSTTIGSSDFPAWFVDSGPGVSVSKEFALSVPSVLQGRNQIAGTIGTLPLCLDDQDMNELTSGLLQQIDPDVANVVTIGQTVEDLLFHAESWWLVLSRGSDGYPTHARHITWENVATQMPKDFPINRLPSGYYQGSLVYLLSELQAVTPNNIIRFESPNPALLRYGARAIRRAFELQLTADRYANNPQAREYFTPTPGEDPDEDTVSKFLAKWNFSRKKSASAYVPPALQLNTLDVANPAELGLNETLEKSTIAIAGLLGLDPEDFGVAVTTRTYQNAVDRRQDRINECYGPYAKAIADRLSMGDITKRGQRVHFDWSEFLKANPTDMATIVTALVAGKIITPDEGRKMLGYPDYTPTQRLELEASTAPASAPELPQQRQRAQLTGRTIDQQYAGSGGLNFSADDDAGLVFDVSDVAGAFSVNETKRTITGLVMPWNQVGRSQGRRWKFAKDSLKFDRSKANQIKLLMNHTNSSAVGRLDKTWSDDAGQWATFKVARGPEGDRALQLAADGVYDGLSVGVGHNDDDPQVQFAADPTGDGGVMYVVSAPWGETSLVPMPAFANARVSAVAFSADNERNTMPDQATPETVPPVAAPITYSAEQMAQMFSMFANGHGAFAPQVAAPAPAPVEAPAVVNPVRESAPAVVNEPPLYRFDGGTAQRCFTADLKAVKDGDTAVKAIVEKYFQTDMAAHFANITPANVASLNPVPTRPDLYVPNLSFSRPLGDSVTTGPLDNLIAFIVPQFSSASGLVGDHTTGTEPTDGAYATTSQTITPKGLSGRVDVDREVIDSGGSPQADQLIYGEMVRAYNEVLEKRIDVMLDALSLSPTGTTIVGTDGTLQANLITFLAGLQFVRGGDRWSRMPLSSTLYNPLVTAKDGEGRLLFPMLNPVNSAGQTSSTLSSIALPGRVGVPAWALETANGGANKSYLIDPNYVYQWNSPPREFRFDQVNVSSVGIAIWGYSAEACTMLSAVKRLVYSAT